MQLVVLNCRIKTKIFFVVKKMLTYFRLSETFMYFLRQSKSGQKAYDIHDFEDRSTKSECMAKFIYSN